VLGIAAAVALSFRGQIQAWLAQRSLAEAYMGYDQELFQKADAIVNASGGYQAELPEPTRRGTKVAWINVVKRALRSRNETIVTLDPDFGYVPEEMRASTPGQAETVVLLLPKSARVGTYVPVDAGGKPNMAGGSLSAFTEMLDVHIVNIKSGRHLGRKRFEWRPKQQVDILAESHIQERNTQEVVGWFTSLPE
jgi:hypothetical protein